MALQLKKYEEAGMLLDEYKKEKEAHNVNWYNRYTIQLYSNSPRHFLDHPQELLKHLEPIAISGKSEDKAKISNTLLSYIYIYENIWTSKMNRQEDRRFFHHFIATILPISAQISYELSNRLSMFKRLIEGEIDTQAYQDLIEFEYAPDASDIECDHETPSIAPELTQRKTRILIIGQPAISNDEIYETAKQYGYQKKAIDMYTDYDKMRNLDIRRFRNDSKYQGIVVGPIPHSVKGRDYDSVIASILSTDSGYPYWIKCTTESGELKITKSAFEKAIQGIRLYQEGNRL